MKLKMILASALVLSGMSVGYAATYYKVGSDGGGQSSFVSPYKVNNTIGWSTTKGASAAETVSNASTSNFIVDGLNLRTSDKTTASSISFGGQSLTLTGNGSLILKRSGDNVSASQTVTVNDLKIEGTGYIRNWMAKVTYTLAGNITLAENAVLICSHAYTSTSSSQARNISLASTLKGPATSTLSIGDSGVNASASAYLEIKNASDFLGTITAPDQTGPGFELLISGSFGGTITSLPSAAKAVKVKYDGLPSGKGLRVASTTIPEALKTKLLLYSSTQDFMVDELPLLVFPSGTEVDPDAFSITCAKDANGTSSMTPALKVITTDDSVVLAVDATVPFYAKYLRVEETSNYAWHFYGANRTTDVTASCGLTEPDETITVLINTVEQAQALSSVSYTAKATLLTSSMTVTEDVDLSSLTTLTAESGVTVDLNGHTVTFPGSFFTSGSATVKGAGEAHVDVASGTTVSNTGVTLTGGLKFVKEGAGTFRASKTGQTYTGGNEVQAGTLVNNAGGKLNETKPFGQNTSTTSCTITVATDAELDFGTGIFNAGYHRVTLDGGTLRVAGTQTNFGLTLTKDSTLILSATATGLSPNLNGCTLTTQDFSGALTSGVITGPGWMNHASSNYCLVFNSAIQPADATTRFSFRQSQAIEVLADIDVKDYDAKLSNGTRTKGAKTMRVFGTFTPTGSSFYGCTLQDGATLDLSGKSEPWGVKSDLTQSGVKNVVTFADNATITVDIGTRQVDSRTAIVSWDDTTRPSNLATLKFKLPNGMPLRKMSDGLYLKPGIVILLQ